MNWVSTGVRIDVVAGKSCSGSSVLAGDCAAAGAGSSCHEPKRLVVDAGAEAGGNCGSCYSS